MHSLPVGDHDHSAVQNFEREYGAIFLRPFSKSALVSLRPWQIREWEQEAYFFPMPEVGIMCAFPRMGIVGGPGGSRGSRLPI